MKGRKLFFYLIFLLASPPHFIQLSVPFQLILKTSLTVIFISAYTLLTGLCVTYLEMLSGEQAEMLVSIESLLSTLIVSKAWLSRYPKGSR